MKAKYIVFFVVAMALVLSLPAYAQSSDGGMFRQGNNEFSLYGSLVFGDNEQYMYSGRYATFMSDAWQLGFSITGTGDSDKFFQFGAYGIDGTYYFSPYAKSSTYMGLGYSYYVFNYEGVDNQSAGTFILGWKNYFSPKAAFFIQGSYTYYFDSDFNQDTIPVTFGFSMLF